MCVVVVDVCLDLLLLLLDDDDDFQSSVMIALSKVSGGDSLVLLSSWRPEIISRNALTHLRQELESRSFVGGGLRVLDVVLVAVLGLLGVVPVTVLVLVLVRVLVVEGDDDSVAMIYKQ